MNKGIGNSIDAGIKDLEQPSPAEVLAAVREEIKSLSNANPSYWHSADLVAREDVFDIIDKHMEELK